MSLYDVALLPLSHHVTKVVSIREESLTVKDRVVKRKKPRNYERIVCLRDPFLCSILIVSPEYDITVVYANKISLINTFLREDLKLV